METSQDGRAGGEVRVELVDGDVHPSPRSATELREYLPEPWRSNGLLDLDQMLATRPMYLPPDSGRNTRLDAYGPNGTPPCSDPEFTARQLFGDAGVDIAILLPLVGRAAANPEHEAAACAACNAWLADTWLSRYDPFDRYRGSIRVTVEDPALAVAEIERWAGHPKFVQVQLTSYSMAPLGQRRFRAIYEAAARHDLPIAIHINRWHGLYLLSPVGFPAYFLETQAAYPFTYMPHLVSFLAEGLFELIPNLRLTLVEGGFMWTPPLMWRLDALWERFGRETPNAKRPPSAYLRDHVRFTSQPLDEPLERGALLGALQYGDAERTLMFASDYPHYDFDDPARILQKLPPKVRRRVASENAIDWYRLPSARGTGPGDVRRAHKLPEFAAAT